MDLAVTKGLAVKSRPNTLAGVVGQDEAVKLLKGAFSSDEVPQQMILAGPTGCGKTTLSRYIASAVNCQKRKSYKTCFSSSKTEKYCPSCKMLLETDNHPDIHEINGADSRKIEDTRALIEQTKVVPVFNYRVFIIDEFQELTGPAMKSILKPIEEPPSHTVWILATMEPGKIPEAIVNRCTQIPIVPMKDKIIAEHIIKIAKKEGVKLGSKASMWIAQMSAGRLRDAVSLLATILLIAKGANSKEITEIDDSTAKALTQSGILGTGPTAIAVLALIYCRNPVVFGFLQRGVTDQLLKDLYGYQDNFISHLSYGNKSWRWKAAYKTIEKVLEKEIRFEAYSLPIEHHITLCALLGKAVVQSRTLGDPGVALRIALSEWWSLYSTGKLIGVEQEDDDE